MKLLRCTFGPFLIALPLACTDTDTASDPQTFRADGLTVDMHAPTNADSVVATLTPGKPFQFNGRYHYAMAPGVEPDMTRFSPEHVGSIARIYSGDTVAVWRGGQVSRARLVGVEEDDQIVFVPEADSPFAHAFTKLPWSAWGDRALAVRGCAAAVEDEHPACAAEAEGDFTACATAAAEELGACASGQDDDVPSALGVSGPLQFECLLPPGMSMSLMGESVGYTPAGFGGSCDCEFWGTLSFEPGDFGCEEVYSGSIVDCEPACDTDDDEDVWDIEGPILD